MLKYIIIPDIDIMSIFFSKFSFLICLVVSVISSQCISKVYHGSMHAYLSTKYNTMIKSLEMINMEGKERDLGKLIVQTKTKSSNNY